MPLFTGELDEINRDHYKVLVNKLTVAGYHGYPTSPFATNLYHLQTAHYALLDGPIRKEKHYITEMYFSPL